MIFAFSSRMLARWIAFLYPGLPEETSIIHFHLDPPPFQNSPLSTDRGVWELARQKGAIACFVKQHMAYDDLDQAIQHAVALVGMLSKEKIDTGLSSVSFFHLLRIDRDKRKARFLLEPSHDLYSAKVALHAHGGDVPAQGFQSGSKVTALDLAVEVQSIGPANADRDAACVRARKDPRRILG